MPRRTQVHIKQYETRSGTRYKLRWKIDGRDNEEGGFDEEAAQLRKNEIERQLLRGQAPLSNAGRRRLSEFAEFHLDTATWLKPLTRSGYRKLVKRTMTTPLTYPDPEHPGRSLTMCLGQMPLRKINYSVVQQWVFAVEAVKGADQRAKAYRCLSGIMSRAVREGEISANPCKVRGASKESQSKRPEIHEDWPWLLSVALAEYTDAYGHHSRARFAAIPVVIGYGTGNRKSELRGLRRRDVHFGLDEARIEIERQAYFCDGEWDTEARTKSEASERSLWIGGTALEALQEHMKTFMRPAEEDPDGNDLVFTGPRGGPVSDSTWSLAWTQAKKDAGVDPKLHLHDLRRHAATALAEDVKDIKHIQSYLGDSTIVAAQRYLDVTDEHRKKSGRALSRRFAHLSTKAPDADVVPIGRRHG